MLNNSSNFIRFNEPPVPVSPGQDTARLLGSINPGIITGEITLNGGILDGYNIIARNPDSLSSSTSRFNLNSPNGVTSYRMAVIPASGYGISGRAFNPPEDQFILTTLDGQGAPTTNLALNVADSAALTIDWTADVPVPGSIAGRVESIGSEVVESHSVRTISPVSRNVSISANGPYELADLAAGTYTMRLFTNFKNPAPPCVGFGCPSVSFQRFLSWPNSAFSNTVPGTRGPEAVVVEGEVTTVDIIAQQSIITGNLKIRGTRSNAEIRQGSIRAAIFGEGNATGGFALDVVAADGAYKFVVTEGTWATYQWGGMAIVNNDPNRFIDQNMRTFNDWVSQRIPHQIAAGETINKDYEYPFGDVTITLSLAGGGTLSNPRLTGTCEQRDETGLILLEYTIDSFGNQQNVPVGSVTLAGPAAICDVEVRGTVDLNGTSLLFGRLFVEVVPGADVVVDVGGPTLVVEAPDPDSGSTVADITVTGTVTDDTGVDSVTVNGIAAATLTSTGNSNDLNEVSFSVDITLAQIGANEIVTVATDTTGKKATDTRNVYLDQTAPALSFTPADATETSDTDITVSGTATDDAKVDLITVNGVEVAFASTNNPADPNEVSFSTQVSIVLGPNSVTVEVTDVVGSTASATHTVTRTDQPANQPPVADAGGPYSALEGGSVGLTGSAVDPDNAISELTFAWDLDNDGTFETAGQNPTFSAAGRDGPDTQTVVLRVCDPVNPCDTESVVVTITNVAPTVTAPVIPIEIVALDLVSVSPITISDPGPDTHTATIDWGDNSALDERGTVTTGFGVSHAYATPAIYTVTITVTDDNLGVGTDTLTITVLSPNQPPVADAGSPQTKEATSEDGASATLNGLGSIDPDGTIASYIWVGPGIVFDDPASATPSAVFPVGDTEVTLTVTDNDGAPAGDTVVITVTPAPVGSIAAKDIKAGALSALEELEGSNKQSQKELDEAIGHLEKSLADELWVVDDPSRLVVKKGKKVFDEEKKAVKSLMKIVKDRGKASDPDIAGDVSEVIAELVNADLLLAETAIGDVPDLEDLDPKLQKKVAKELARANDALNEAQEELEKGKPDKAIDEYKKAWEHAVKAAREATKKAKNDEDEEDEEDE